MGEAKTQEFATAPSPEQATGADSSMRDTTTDAEVQEWQAADTQLFGEGTREASCPAWGRSQGEVISDAGSGTLEALLSEVAALQVAMVQSEAIFLDLEAQLRAGFEREETSQGRIAALERQVQAAIAQGRIAARSGSAQQGTAQPQHAALDASGPAPASPGKMVESNQDACEQAAGASAKCHSHQEGSSQRLQSQAQVILAQLRSTQRRANDAEGIIGRLQNQVFDQQALIAELQSSLTAAQANPPPAEQAGCSAAQQMDGGTLTSEALGAQQLLATPQVAVVRSTGKGSLPGPVHGGISQLLVAYTLIAGQSESPEELSALILRENSTFAPKQRGPQQTGLPAPPAPAASMKGDWMERTASTHSSSDNMTENPLFLRCAYSGVPLR
jgi:hypothetical protein